MSSAKRQNDDEDAPVSSELTFPAGSFPHKYLHCALDDLETVVQAVLALRATGHEAGKIHAMASWDYEEARARQRQQQSGPLKILRDLLALLDEGFGDVYLREARRGRHILMVRLAGYEQAREVCELLAPYRAHLMKYVDTWTVIDLPSPGAQSRDMDHWLKSPLS